ncbi:MAG: apolipoprotein N-acyltransferase, partial [Spirochaetales bacterium]|nr:apolipoprotein N-acyltransferase [Spirochaetales bacterium]
FCLILVYGSLSIPGKFNKSINIVLVQNKNIAFLERTDRHRESFEKLKKLTDKAVSLDPDLVIWPELAFFPSINWYYRYRNTFEKSMIEDLKDYLSARDLHVLIGNPDITATPAGNGGYDIKTYNASLLFVGEKVTGVYRKQHLVPFGEYFPYAKMFPDFYQWLQGHPDVDLFTPGENNVPMEVDGIKFSPVICFEDSFPDISRNMVLKGAQFLVNQTSDSLAYSEVASVQHLLMAVFRCVENKRGMARATNYGMTAFISPNGRIMNEIPFSAEDFCADELPVAGNEKTFYTLYGDWLIILITVILFTVIIIKTGFYIYYLWVKNKEK